MKPKSRVLAGVLAIVLGQLGIHNFYLGYIARGIIQLAASIIFSGTLIVPILVWIWAIYEGVQILSGKAIDKNGNPLV